jgi:IS5 family transposase
MRHKRIGQLSFSHITPKCDVVKELEIVSSILDANPEVYDLAFSDLVGLKQPDTGRTGMKAEQVVRCMYLKQSRNLTYEELAFHLSDSIAMRAFARLDRGQYPTDSTLQENIKAIGPETWEFIHGRLIGYAEDEGIEKGRKVRIDSTSVESNIHHPTDATLLQDGVRLITRLLVEGKTLSPAPRYTFSDHRRVVKRRVLKIQNAKKPEERKKSYAQLLEIAGRVRGYAAQAIPLLYAHRSKDVTERMRARMLAEELERAVSTFDRVIDQTRRRVILGEKVPACEKVVSFFECHADIIEKGGRESVFGHKVFLVGGASGLIVDCVVPKGNPADSAMFIPMMERQKLLYGRAPRQASADGGFASGKNLRDAKGMGIKDVSFSKRKGLSIQQMVKSAWVYRMLKNFRAGIEANISRLKRVFGLNRCDWTGWVGFKQYVWSAIVSYNLTVMARLKMQPA